MTYLPKIWIAAFFICGGIYAQDVFDENFKSFEVVKEVAERTTIVATNKDTFISLKLDVAIFEETNSFTTILEHSNLIWAAYSIGGAEPSFYDQKCECWYKLPGYFRKIQNGPLPSNRVERVQQISRRAERLPVLKDSAIKLGNLDDVYRLSVEQKAWKGFHMGHTNHVTWLDTDGERSIFSVVDNKGESTSLYSPNGMMRVATRVILVEKERLNPCETDGFVFFPLKRKMKDVPRFKHPGFAGLSKDGIWRVQFVFAGSDAFKMGLRPGHQVLSINGKDIHKLSFDDLFNEMTTYPLRVGTRDKDLGEIKIPDGRPVEDYYEDDQGTTSIYKASGVL